MSKPDVLIIGGGPAGMSALLWCRSLNLEGILLEAGAEPGGQMLQMFHPIPDYPGLPGLTGREMRDRFVDQLRDLGLDWRTDCRVESIDPLTRTVTWAGGELQAQGLVIATGARKRTLDVPGAERFALRGVSFSGTRDHSLYAGRKVCVVGGGDSAIENCLILSRVCPEVTLIHRSDRFRARQAWLDAARPTAETLDALASAERIVIAPSNPLISIGPILAIPGIRDAIPAARSRGALVVGFSPMVGGKALKGPVGRRPSARGPASNTEVRYRGSNG